MNWCLMVKDKILNTLIYKEVTQWLGPRQNYKKKMKLYQ